MKDGRPFAELRKPEQVKLWESLWFVSTGRYDSIRWTVSAGKARHQQLHPLQLDVCFQGVLREQHCYAKGRHTCDALFEAKLSCVICDLFVCCVSRSFRNENTCTQVVHVADQLVEVPCLVPAPSLSCMCCAISQGYHCKGEQAK